MPSDTLDPAVAHAPDADVPDAQRTDCARLKAHFPYRIVYAAFNPATGEWITNAVTTKARPHALARKGWRVWTA